MNTSGGAPTQELSQSTIACSSDKFLANCSNVSKSLWAKTGDDEQWMNLPQHMADSMCAAGYVWADWLADSVKIALCRFTGLEVGEVQRLYLFLAFGHDLGKAHPDFSGMAIKIPGQGHLAEAVEDAGLSLHCMHERTDERWLPHGRSSGYIMRTNLTGLGYSPRLANALGSVVEAHHGISSAVKWKNLDSSFRRLPDEWKSVQTELFEGVYLATDVEQVLKTLEVNGKDLNADALQLLTGLVVMADWIASNTKAFPLQIEGGRLRPIVWCTATAW